MPYKHIATHLKKTELACRLHYHQLSHGSNRRKRTASTSSGTSSVTFSPSVLHASIPSTVLEDSPSPNSNPASPPSYSYSPVSPAPTHIQLPSASTLLAAASPPQSQSQAHFHPVTILPKPTLPRRSLSDTTAAHTAPLRLNCAVGSTTPFTNFANIDKDRLRKVYEAYRAGFWQTIAAEYGEGVNPLLLEDAWRRGSINAPPTPCISPEETVSPFERSVEKMAVIGNTSTITSSNPSSSSSSGKNSATSISALLGIDASPRSPKEREIIRRLEEGARMEMEMM